MRFVELHSVQWGPIRGSSETCVRLNDSLFDVHIDISRKGESSYWFKPGGLPPFELPTAEPFLLGGIAGLFLSIVGQDDPDPEFPDDCGMAVQVRLHRSMPSVAFVPNPKLARAGVITFEQAMAIANPAGTVHHGLGYRYLLPFRLLMRPQLNGDTLAGRRHGARGKHGPD